MPHCFVILAATNDAASWHVVHVDLSVSKVLVVAKHANSGVFVEGEVDLFVLFAALVLVLVFVDLVLVRLLVLLPVFVFVLLRVVTVIAASTVIVPIVAEHFGFGLDHQISAVICLLAYFPS